MKKMKSTLVFAMISAILKASSNEPDKVVTGIVLVDGTTREFKIQYDFEKQNSESLFETQQ